MAISPKMLAVLQKVDAKREAHFAGLRESAKRDAEAKVRAKRVASLRMAQAARQEKRAE
jgi:hypothetical protein